MISHSRGWASHYATINNATEALLQNGWSVKRTGFLGLGATIWTSPTGAETKCHTDEDVLALFKKFWPKEQDDDA